MITTPRQLRGMATALAHVQQIAVDVEYSPLVRYAGAVALIQLATVDTVYVIDALAVPAHAIRTHLAPILVCVSVMSLCLAHNTVHTTPWYNRPPLRPTHMSSKFSTAATMTSHGSVPISMQTSSTYSTPTLPLSNWAASNLRHWHICCIATATRPIPFLQQKPPCKPLIGAPAHFRQGSLHMQ